MTDIDALLQEANARSRDRLTERVIGPEQREGVPAHPAPVLFTSFPVALLERESTA